MESSSEPLEILSGWPLSLLTAVHDYELCIFAFITGRIGIPTENSVWPKVLDTCRAQSRKASFSVADFSFVWQVT